LFRRLAAEEGQSLPSGARLFVAITAAESAQSWLVDHLCRLRDMLGGNRKLVVEIPDSSVRPTEDFRALRAVLRDAQIELAYDGFASGKAHITEREDVLGDFLKLAPSTLRSVHRGEDRQRQVQLIMRACRDIGCAVIVTGIDSEADHRVCRELGCGLAQGEVLGRPQPLSDILHASRSPVRAESLTK
jgi:EAL domain-containing protein (putative c-di-GMP-specific phosphodiesterase class I)